MQGRSPMARTSGNGDRKRAAGAVKKKKKTKGRSSRESDPVTREGEEAGKSPEELMGEGRRCALCGEARESAEAMAAEKLNPDSTVGRSGLGRLLGPLSDRMGVAALWVHQECAVWSPEVYFLGVGCLKNVKAALRRGRFLKCSRCGQPGATIGCRVSQCPRTYHLPCARVSGCSFNHKKYLMSCPEHAGEFLRQDKKRLRECMLTGAWGDETKKPPSKDSKLPETTATTTAAAAAEDDEFLKRERKRLQRDLARLAPIKLGGPLSNNSNNYTPTFEGWESIGGLQNVVQCLKEMVTIPLLYPGVFQELGIVPPRGVLLHGYPGTGKTHVVRALLGACSRGEKPIAYFARKGADCLGKYVGDSERQLRLLFQLAEQAQPSIIFFDELDGLAPRRSRNQDQTLSSVVSTLLALMDGLNPRGSVVVIGATNRPDALDPALRRAGRFDREIFFPLPSTADREAILGIHTRSWRKPPSRELLASIARATVGYAGADLRAVSAQAAMVALRRSARARGFLGDDDSREIDVRDSDWIEALARSGAPCSRRMIGSALSEVKISPLPGHLVHLLLRPVILVFLHLDSDGRFFLPARLRKPLALARESFSSGSGLLEDACRGTGMFSDEFSGDSSAGEADESGSLMVPLVNGWRMESFRVLLSGASGDGKSLVAAAVLHVLQSSMQVFVLSIQTMIQAGDGDINEGLIRILESAKAVSSVVFMPGIDSWALEKQNGKEEVLEKQNGKEEALVSSAAWGTFLQQTRSMPSHLPVLFLATCEQKELPVEISSFFTSSSRKSSAGAARTSYSSRATIQLPVPSESEVQEVFKRAAKTLVNNLQTTLSSRAEEQAPAAEAPVKSFELPRASPAETSSTTSNSQEPRNALQEAIRCCGHQLLNSPHLMLFRQTTSRLTSGPSLFLENPYSGLWIIKDPPADAGETQAPAEEKNTTESQAPGEERNTGKEATETQAPIDEKNTNKEANPSDQHGEEAGATGENPTQMEVDEKQEQNAAKRLLEALGPDDEEFKDENRRVWGLQAVGLKACKGFYKTGAELVSEMNLVLELLRQRLEKKSKSRRRQWHRCQLLAQAGALQDLMECWLHEIRRLENREKVSTQARAQAPDESDDGDDDDASDRGKQGDSSQEDPQGPRKRRKLESPAPPMMSYDEALSVFLSNWEKQGRSSKVEVLHDIVSETSAEVFSSRTLSFSKAQP